MRFALLLEVVLMPLAQETNSLDTTQFENDPSVAIGVGVVFPEPQMSDDTTGQAQHVKLQIKANLKTHLVIIILRDLKYVEQPVIQRDL